MIPKPFIILFKFIAAWWWIICPFILLRPFLFLYLWWRNEKWGEKQKYIMLEIKMPREVKRPFKAMEQVFAGWWMLYDPPDWWEKWIEGKYQLSMSIELVSNGGEIHFYLRIPEPARNFIESSIYSQYPDAEIFQVEDYTKDVPQDIPNEEWDLWGCDYELIKPDIYPIKTYSQFFEEKAEVIEEKRIDPLASLLEGMSKLRPGEQIWVQFRLTPVTNNENDYKDRAQKTIEKMLKKPGKAPPKPILKEALDALLLPPKKEEKKAEVYLPEIWILPPGEKEKTSAIANKVSKVMYECGIRFIILGKRDIFYKPNLKTVLSFFANFNTENLNGFKPWGKSITKVHKHENLFLNIFFHDSLLYLKKRRIFKRYLQRLDYLFPKKGKRFILNIEELASIFHLIGREAVPAPEIVRIESKKAEPPPNLPT
jgi:hypothetical protein